MRFSMLTLEGHTLRAERRSGGASSGAAEAARSAVALDPIMTARHPMRGSHEIPHDRRDRDAHRLARTGGAPTHARASRRSIASATIA